MKGNYLQSPIWNLTKRREARLHADMTYALTVKDIENMSVQEIYDRISKLLSYDEYKWQRDTGLKITYHKRAEGLHMPLYRCYHCKTEYSMESECDRLTCRCCGMGWTMDEYGTLVEDKTKDELYIPDWYEWERDFVEQEIDKGEYLLDSKVVIHALPNAVNFIDCGEGHIRHNEDGFILTFVDYEDKKEKTLVFYTATLSSIHTEYDYRGKGQCFVLSTSDNSYFIYPLEKDFNVTKVQFAAEYLYEKRRRGRSGS